MNLNVPQQATDFTNLMLVALTIYREASGEPLEGKYAVAWVIRNRVEHPSWYGHDYCDVVTKKAQFTSMVPPDGVDDPNLRRYPKPTEQVWLDCLQVVTDVISGVKPDPTGGATMYFAKWMKAAPPWAAAFDETVRIGQHIFLKARG
jgi:spore germination cell wall hydrolase CwlJ-like protein